MRPHHRGETGIRTALVVMGVVTATPAYALVDPSMLGWAYGVPDPQPITLALLQHRGMLQLLLGAALVGAAFAPAARQAVALAAVLGKSTFLLLVLPDPDVRGGVTLFSIVFDLACPAPPARGTGLL